MVDDDEDDEVRSPTEIEALEYLLDLTAGLRRMMVRLHVDVPAVFVETAEVDLRELIAQTKQDRAAMH